MVRVVKTLPASVGDMRHLGLIPESMPWRKTWQSTPLFLPEKPHGQRSLAGYSPRVAKSQTELSD